MADNITVTLPYSTKDGREIPVTFQVPKDKLKIENGSVIGGDENFLKNAAQMAFEARYPNEAGIKPPSTAPGAPQIQASPTHQDRTGPWYSRLAQGAMDTIKGVPNMLSVESTPITPHGSGPGALRDAVGATIPKTTLQDRTLDAVDQMPFVHGVRTGDIAGSIGETVPSLVAGAAASPRLRSGVMGAAKGVGAAMQELPPSVPGKVLGGVAGYSLGTNLPMHGFGTGVVGMELGKHLGKAVFNPKAVGGAAIEGFKNGAIGPWMPQIAHPTVAPLQSEFVDPLQAHGGGPQVAPGDYGKYEQNIPYKPNTPPATQGENVQSSNGAIVTPVTEWPAVPRPYYEFPDPTTGESNFLPLEFYTPGTVPESMTPQPPQIQRILGPEPRPPQAESYLMPPAETAASSQFNKGPEVPAAVERAPKPATPPAKPPVAPPIQSPATAPIADQITKINEAVAAKKAAPVKPPVKDVSAATRTGWTAEGLEAAQKAGLKPEDLNKIDAWANRLGHNNVTGKHVEKYIEGTSKKVEPVKTEPSEAPPVEEQVTEDNWWQHRKELEDIRTKVDPDAPQGPEKEGAAPKQIETNPSSGIMEAVEGFLKKRKTVTSSQVAEAFAIPVDLASRTMKLFESSGKVSRSGGNWSYKEAPAAEIKPNASKISQIDPSVDPQGYFGDVLGRAAEGVEISHDDLYNMARIIGVQPTVWARALLDVGYKVQESKFPGKYGLNRSTKTPLPKEIQMVVDTVLKKKAAGETPGK